MVHKRLFNKICCSLVGRCKSGKALDFSRNKGAVREAVLLVTVCYVKWHPVCRNFPFPGHPVQLCNTFPVGLHSELDREELLLLNTAQIPELTWPRHLQVDNQMPTLASVQITLIYSLELVWSCPARTMPPRLSVIVCRLIRKATHLKHIWGGHGGGWWHWHVLSPSCNQHSVEIKGLVDGEQTLIAEANLKARTESRRHLVLWSIQCTPPQS